MARKSRNRKSVQLIKTVKQPEQAPQLSRAELRAELSLARFEALGLVTDCIIDADTRLSAHGMTLADIS